MNTPTKIIATYTLSSPESNEILNLVNPDKPYMMDSLYLQASYICTSL